MTHPMVEAMARAICRARWDKRPWHGACTKAARLDWCANNYWREFVPEAQVALTVLLEPDEHMAEAMWFDLPGRDPTLADCKDAFTAAIRSLLEEP
jgi:hypothetical protein